MVRKNIFCSIKELFPFDVVMKYAA